MWERSIRFGSFVIDISPITSGCARQYGCDDGFVKSVMYLGIGQSLNSQHCLNRKFLILIICLEFCMIGARSKGKARTVQLLIRCTSNVLYMPVLYFLFLFCKALDK